MEKVRLTASQLRARVLRDMWVMPSLVGLAVVVITAAIFVANWSAEIVLRRDATNMAVQWTDLLIENFRSIRHQDGNVDRGTHVEMISKQLLAAFQAKGPESAAEVEASAAVADPDIFHRGRYVSQIYRYAIFGRDGSIFAKSGRFDSFDELDMSTLVGGAREFQQAAIRGEIVSKMLPRHI